MSTMVDITLRVMNRDFTFPENAIWLGGRDGFSSRSA
jgi:hypothetical protein